MTKLGKTLKVSIITVSDRASRGEYEDKGGPAIRELLGKVFASKWEADCVIVPDEVDVIKDALINASENLGSHLVVTTGGTGPARRDVTPEATSEVLEKTLPGFGELMRAVSLKIVPTAILSRQIAGIRGGSLIINLPGKPSAIEDCLLAVLPAVVDCLDLLDAPNVEITKGSVPTYRPHKKKQSN
ncbi:MAG: molybdopterin adenylyltransferase [Deltaproteobacteria bacterium]|nr:molybdopterin adenylyltransferase [Deltaproteobacteria bacterium]